ncbi:MAG: hypothetical protein JZD40_01220 [Sulfolobus sp.]|nr:hypothetical protein [Sulfolobus sp.]
MGVIGVDVSKDKLTIYCEGSTRELPNDEKGFQELLNRELHDALTKKLVRVTWAVWYYNMPFDYSPRD